MRYLKETRAEIFYWQDTKACPGILLHQHLFLDLDTLDTVNRKPKPERKSRQLEAVRCQQPQTLSRRNPMKPDLSRKAHGRNHLAASHCESHHGAHVMQESVSRCPWGRAKGGSHHGTFCSWYLVVVEVSVDGEPVCAQALQIAGAVSLGPPLNVHEGGVAPGPQQLRRILLSLLLISTTEVIVWKDERKVTPHSVHACVTREADMFMLLTLRFCCKCENKWFWIQTFFFIFYF